MTLAILSLWGYTPKVRARLKIFSKAGVKIEAEILTNLEVISSGPEELLFLMRLIVSENFLLYYFVE